MNGARNNIRRIVFVGIWLLAGAGIVVLLIAAAKSRAHERCEGYSISINGNEEGKWFINKKEVLKVISSGNTSGLKGQPVQSFDVNKIELKLKKQTWVKDANVFFDNKGILKVNVAERVPVARIFNTAGESFYIDSTGKKLPLSDKMSVKLPVFTGYPFSGKKVNTAEKKLLNNVKEVSLYLANDEFWMAQVAQVYVTPSREFEIIPTVGGHVIEFGDASNMEEKFRRLFVFYRQVLAIAGMEKYERIKVQYDDQVIGVKKSDNN